MTSYPTPAFRRTALAPGILAAIVLMAGFALIGGTGFVWIQFATSILAIIVAVYAWQAKQWWWLIGLVPIAVLWNPIATIDIHNNVLWFSLQYIAAIVFIACGIFIKVPNPDDRNARTR